MKLRNETFFTVSRNNSKHFFSYFRVFSVSRIDRNSAKQWLVSYNFGFCETKKKYETVNPLLRESLLIYMKYLTMAYYLYRYFVNIYRNWRLFLNCLTFNSVLPFLISVQSDRSSWLCIYLYIYKTYPQIDYHHQYWFQEKGELCTLFKKYFQEFSRINYFFKTVY